MLPAQAEEGLGLVLLEVVEGKRARVLPQGYFEYSLEPGGQAEGTIEVTNVGDNPVRLQTYPGDCVNSPSGDLVGPLAGEPNRSVGNWLTGSTSEVQLAGRERKRLPVRVSVPAGTPAGDYFGFYFIQPEAPEQQVPKAGAGELGVGLKVESRLGVIFLCHVSPGSSDTRRFQLPAGADGVRKVKQDGQLWLEVSIENPGKLFLKPLASWALTDPQGQLVARQDARPSGYLLPGHPVLLRLSPTAQQTILARGRYRLEVKVQDSRFPEVQAQQVYEVPLP